MTYLILSQYIGSFPAYINVLNVNDYIESKELMNMLNKEKNHRIKEFAEHVCIISFFILSVILGLLIIFYVPYGVYILIAILWGILLFFYM